MKPPIPFIPDKAGQLPRQSERADERTLAFVVPTTENLGARRKVLILDLSPQGARVQCDIPLPVGTVLELIPPQGPEYAVQCRVIWTGEVGSDAQGESGLEFLANYPPTLAA